MSMPSTGFYSFLQFFGDKTCNIDGMCQCPQRASTHFYKYLKSDIVSKPVCQCPQRASTHFYHMYNHYMDHNLWVSMPSTGFYSFLHHYVTLLIINQLGVNALNGLLLISTNKIRKVNNGETYVSMPSTGFYSFLPVTSRKP